MSVSALPEWKQLLLERKRKDEEERERREREEEEKLASMPAWKRGIIQRRRAKQEVSGERDREKEREAGQQVADGKPAPDVIGNAENSVQVQLESELALGLDQEESRSRVRSKTQNRVFTETIGPIRQNPFIRSQVGWRSRKETERPGDGFQDRSSVEVRETGRERERDKERMNRNSHEREFWRGMDREMMTEIMRDRNRGRERDRSGGREPLREKERDNLKRRKDREEDGETATAIFPLVPGLRTIKADNIIIIEKDKKRDEREKQKGNKDEWGKQEELTEEEKRGMRMDLREFLAGGGSVTEIKASEVLIIKPSLTEERGAGVKAPDRETGIERRNSRSMENMIECKGERAWRRQREGEQDRAELGVRSRPRSNMRKEDRQLSHEMTTQPLSVSEQGSRVSQLLSKFGEHPKPPSRSKSTDCFVRPGRDQARHSTGNLWVQGDNEGTEEGANPTFRGVPKRSYSFSDRVVSARESGITEDGSQERRVLERTYSDRRAQNSEHEVANSDGRQRGVRRWGRSFDKEYGVVQGKGVIEGERWMEEKMELNSRMERDCSTGERGSENWTSLNVNPVAKVMEGAPREMNRDEGFTMASVKNTEGIGYAKRVPIRQDGRNEAERETIRFHEGNERERVAAGESERDRKIQREMLERETQAEFKIEEKTESIRWRRDQQEVTLVVESVQSHCTYIQHPEHNPEHYNVQSRAVSTFKEHASIHSSMPYRMEESAAGTDAQSRGTVPTDWHGQRSAQTVLSQHTEDLICKSRVQETRSDRENHGMSGTYPQDEDVMYSSTESDKGVNAYQTDLETLRETGSHSLYNNYSKTGEEETYFIPKSPTPKRSVSVVQSATQGEVQIPRTVFYGVEETSERRRNVIEAEEGQGRIEEGGRRVERRESWKVGRPLTRVESLREQIRQRERERQRSVEGREEGGREGREEWMDGVENREMWQKSQRESRQEGPGPQTVSLLDVTQEVGLSKAGPELPVPPLLHLQALSTEEEVERISVSGCEVPLCKLYAVEQEKKDTAQHVEEFGFHKRWRRLDTDRERESGGGGGGGGEGEDREREDEQLEEVYLPPSDSPSPTSSLSPSPPFPSSLDTMSRIYNLRTSGSRTTVCIGGRSSDVSSHSTNKTQPTEQYKPLRHSLPSQLCPQEPQRETGNLWTNRKVTDDKISADEEVSVVQRQVEKLQLREQDVARHSSHSDEKVQSSVQKSPFREREVKTAQGQKKSETQRECQIPNTQPKDQTATTSPRILHGQQRPQAQKTQVTPLQSRSFTVNTKASQSAESSQKLLERGTTPANVSSPSSVSPSSSLSPSPSPSPPLFTIRSASAGPGKRGTTITITPRRSAGGASGAPAGSGNPSTSRTSPQGQTPAPNSKGEPGKKRYPTVDEIEVIGGYQNLERSCLVKNKGTPKRVKVCFDEEQLERVCEYPSESSMLASLPPSPLPVPEQVRAEKGRGEVEEEDEDEEEKGVFMSKNNKSLGTGRVLRVDESCRR